MNAYALVTDLIFRSKIMEAAKEAQVKIIFVSDFYKIVDSDLIFIDLEKFGAECIQKIKEKNKNAKIVGYLSHKNTELIEKAKNEKCDIILPRSEFSKRLKELFL